MFEFSATRPFLFGWILCTSLLSCDGKHDTQVESGTDSIPEDPEQAPVGFLALSDVVDIHISPAAAAVNGDFTGDGIEDLAFWRLTATIIEGPLDSYVDLEDEETWHSSVSGVGTELRDYDLAAGDQSGDGVADLAMGAYEVHDNGDLDFYIFLYNGPFSGHRTLGETTADAMLYENGIHSAGGLLSLGDVSGDGKDDILIGAPTGSESGAAYLVLGPASGASNLVDADTIFEGESGMEHTGKDLSTHGDANGDGIGDVLVGSIGTDGGLFFFHGPPPSGTVSVVDADSMLQPNYVGGGSEPAVGDSNGDGYDDVLVGNGCGYGSCNGAAWLHLGPFPASFTPSDAEATIQHDVANSYFGDSSSLEQDLDGDGRADLAAGASDDRSSDEWIGGVYIYYGPVSGNLWTEDADAVIKGARSGSEPDSGPGAWIGPAGDANDDGYDDLFFTGRDAGLDSGSFIVFGGER